ncbi:MAG: hypothetical protein HOF74_09230 [Gammaproteobacteria bacterium]|jgi:hypothetical protein|nr:hypothetical protein [Gammaproteobacteria bacterium]MBT3859998.1 hypothetical protein [Gammaproteobacteria bacterium]MBT3987052.1 hypothetical protein [Gammaproteobacteria bacterium]MBT4256106.1 hypothetical protein [Gammaproteobacteria bacterium]MBT4580683.1 hypothetical protein [Gammaproteobacteria bacterium]
MSFDEDNNENKEKKSKTFFGLEMSDGVVYTVVVILTLIFIRQVSIVLDALG